MSSAPQILLQQSEPRRRILAGSAALLLAALVVALFCRDLEGRREAVSLLQTAGLAARPGVSETVGFLETSDLASNFAIETLLSELAPGGGAAGAAARYGAGARGMLAEAVRLSAASLAGRPGSAFGRLLVARGAYAAWDMEANPPPAGADAWQAAFGAASEAAPELELVKATAASASLSAWPRLTAGQRESAAGALARAFASRDFVQRSFPLAWRHLGGRALALVPDRPEALTEAAALLRAMGEPGPAGEADARLARLTAR